MANANGSNRAKHLRRIKRSNTQLKRSVKQYQLQWFNTQCVLVAVLSQQGGEATITQGTYRQAVEGVVKGELSYAAAEGKTAQEMVVRVVTQGEKVTDS